MIKAERSYEFHPIAGIFPLLEGDELEALADDIRQNGLRQPVTLYEGKVLDGRNRVTACLMAGVKPTTQLFTGSRIEALAYVWSENRHRRHLSSSQAGQADARREKLHAEYAADVAKMRAEAEVREKVGKGSDGSGGRGRKKNPTQKIEEGLSDRNERSTDATRAKAVGTNRQYVADCRKLEERAPDLADQVLAGRLTVPRAKAELQRRERTAELKAKAKAAKRNGNGEAAWKIVQGDSLDLLAELTDRPRLILADPPYNIGIDYGGGAKADKLPRGQYVAWAEEWLDLCLSRLAPDGTLWVMIGDEYAAEYAIALDKLGAHRRAWVKWYETFGVNCANNFNRCSRHLFYCVKDPKRFVFHPEAVLRPSARQAKYGDSRAAPNGKIWDDVWVIPRLPGNAKERIPGFPTQVPLAIARAIVGACSDPGDLVVDPFSGSATTGAAAIELGRRYLGFEQSAEFAKLSRTRLQAMEA